MYMNPSIECRTLSGFIFLVLKGHNSSDKYMSQVFSLTGVSVQILEFNFEFICIYVETNKRGRKNSHSVQFDF